MRPFTRCRKLALVSSYPCLGQQYLSGIGCALIGQGDRDIQFDDLLTAGRHPPGALGTNLIVGASASIPQSQTRRKVSFLGARTFDQINRVIRGRCPEIVCRDGRNNAPVAL
jgi:hypothetical protein